MRTLWVLAAVILTSGVGCQEDSVSTRIRHLPSPTVVQTPSPVGDNKYLHVPASRAVQIGVRYRYRLYTHCGIDLSLVDFDGSFWDFRGPGQPDDGSDNPPAGFGNPYDNGTMVLVSVNLAEYTSSNGVIARFSRHVGSKIMEPCA